MLADLAALPEPPSVPPELRMAVADTPAGMEDWQRGFAAGFSVIDSTAGDYHAAYTQSLENRIHYVGYVGDAPVAIAMLLCAADVACLWDIATAPESRRKGYAACLTRVALDDARRRGHRHATLNASRLGRSVYASVGFSLTCEVPEFRFESGS
jgi:GNAT superfamily N-acetyltransferase